MIQLHHHPLVGMVSIRKSSKARRISITVKPDRVVMTLPLRTPVTDGLEFLDSKTEWILKNIQKLAKRMTESRILPPFSTYHHRLEVVYQERVDFTWVTYNGVLIVKFPQGADILSEECQQFLRKTILDTYRQEAREVLSVKTEKLAAKFGFKFTGLTFRNAKTRWGSCSVKNSISLNIQLMSLPDYLIDYIILHELCHTVHKNHGKKFHALLDMVTNGKHPQYRNELKKYRLI